MGEIATKGSRGAYFPEKFYSMQSDPMLEMLAASENLNPQARVLLLAQSRMNRWGHCPFQEGELFAKIGTKDRRTVISAINAFKQAGAFAPDSSPLCIVLPARAYRRNDRATQRCIEPKHFSKQERMWVDRDFGWEKHPGQWHEYMADPERKAAIAARELTGWTVTREVQRETVIRETIRETATGIMYSDYGNPMCGQCGVPLNYAPDGATYRCPYGHEYAAPGRAA